MALTLASAGSIVTAATWEKKCTINAIPVSCTQQESRKVVVILEKYSSK